MALLCRPHDRTGPPPATAPIGTRWRVFRQGHVRVTRAPDPRTIVGMLTDSATFPARLAAPEACAPFATPQIHRP
jgi:hypothetical protein